MPDFAAQRYTRPVRVRASSTSKQGHPLGLTGTASEQLWPSRGFVPGGSMTGARRQSS